MSCSRTFASRKALETALAAAGLKSPVASTRDLSGGCIHKVREVALADGTRVVAKSNAAAARGLFEEEAAGLRALAATGCVLVPEPLAVVADAGTAILLMGALAPAEATTATWRRFGAELAALHEAPGDARGRYGFDADNHLGTTPQPNTWHDDWVAFNAECRLGHQLALARARGRLGAPEVEAIERVIGRLDRLIPRSPRPALLHGDLWSGNALPARDRLTDETRIGLIDPACSYGDGWADVAMMQLFGGFPAPCFETYREATGDPDTADVETRIAVYQLYHVLNHVNLFGAGYVGQALALAGRLT